MDSTSDVVLVVKQRRESLMKRASAVCHQNPARGRRPTQEPMQNSMRHVTGGKPGIPSVLVVHLFRLSFSRDIRD